MLAATRICSSGLSCLPSSWLIARFRMMLKKRPQSGPVYLCDAGAMLRAMIRHAGKDSLLSSHACSVLSLHLVQLMSARVIIGGE